MKMSDILVRPLVTEKTTTQLPTEEEFAFEVGLEANKIQVKEAIERFYGVEVASVRTAVVRGKMKRHGRHHGKRRNWKKAYVRLAPGQTLNVYDV